MQAKRNRGDGRAGGRRGLPPDSLRRARQAAAFSSGRRSVSLVTTRWAGNPSSSAGWLPRLIQNVVKPKDAAPATSHELDETKPVASGAVPSFLDASWYTRGLGL